MKTKILLHVLLTLTFPAFVTAGKISILNNDSLDIPVGKYVVVHFGIQPYQSENTQIEGVIQTTQADRQIEVILFHQDDYYRWMHNPRWDVDTLGYASSLSGFFNFPVNAFGSMSLVLSNRGNMSHTTVVCSVLVAFSGSGIPDDPLFDALQIFLVLLAITASVTVIGAVYTELAKRKQKG